MNFALAIASLLSSFFLEPGALPGSWSGDYAPCDGHQELLKTGHLSLGVRFSITDPRLRVAFARALDFWATVLDMKWRRDDGRGCSIHVFTGAAHLFGAAETARAQSPDQPSFQGWIAFNPSVPLSEDEQYLVSVHELGHTFGLPHNPSAKSIMFFLGVDGPWWLDTADIEALAARHKLRVHRAPVPVPAGVFAAAAKP